MVILLNIYNCDTTESSETIFQEAKDLGFELKIHAEQLSWLGGASLAARYGALSADHLEYMRESDVIALNKSGTVAVLLPGAFYFLRETQIPPIELLRKNHVPIALATDFNPGTSPINSLSTIMGWRKKFMEIFLCISPKKDRKSWRLSMILV